MGHSLPFFRWNGLPLCFCLSVGPYALYDALVGCGLIGHEGYRQAKEHKEGQHGQNGQQSEVECEEHGAPHPAGCAGRWCIWWSGSPARSHPGGAVSGEWASLPAADRFGRGRRQPTWFASQTPLFLLDRNDPILPFFHSKTQARQFPLWQAIGGTLLLWGIRCPFSGGMACRCASAFQSARMRSTMLWLAVA